MNTPFQNIEPQKHSSNKTRTMRYRFGFNGMENDNEVKGAGNQIDFKFRGYDPRLGRFLSIDPLHRNFSFSSPYVYALNRVIDGKDLEGLEYTPYWHMDYPEVTDVTSAVQFFNTFLYNSTIATVYNTSSAAINISTSAAVGIKNEGVATYTHKVATKAAVVVKQIATTPITLKDVKTSFTTVENYEAVPMLLAGAAFRPKLSPMVSSVGSVWSKNPLLRGLEIESRLGGNLPANFPTIDRFFKGVAESIKSIDLNLPTYQNPANLRSTLKSYVNKLDQFEGASFDGVNIAKEQTKMKRLTIAIPEGVGSKAQMDVLNNIATYGKELGIDVNIVTIK